MARYLNHRVVGYCYCYCCCCVHVLCYCCVLYNPPDHHPYILVSIRDAASRNMSHHRYTALWVVVVVIDLSLALMRCRPVRPHSHKIREDESFRESEMGQDFLGLVCHLWH